MEFYNYLLFPRDSVPLCPTAVTSAATTVSAETSIVVELSRLALLAFLFDGGDGTGGGGGLRLVRLASSFFCLKDLRADMSLVPLLPVRDRFVTEHTLMGSVWMPTPPNWVELLSETSSSCTDGRRFLPRL